LNLESGKHYSRTSYGYFMPLHQIQDLLGISIKGWRLELEVMGANCLYLRYSTRYHQIPTFGQGKICKFATNASEMKRLAARDYEDLLQVRFTCYSKFSCSQRFMQCAIPAIEGLLPGIHNKRIMKLLYRTAELHALAKARMHTDASLDVLEKLTVEFGQLMREFRDLTCSDFSTVELPREAAARVRRQSDRTTNIPTASSSAPSSSRQPKKFNLLTYKFHALGDYVRSIRLFGTTDSYSTQLVRASDHTWKVSS
jgi:hypothetical protein